MKALWKIWLVAVCALVMGVNSAVADDATENKDSWGEAGDLGEMWKSRKLHEMDRKELEKELLEDTPWWELTESLWRTYEGGKRLEISGEKLQDVLFVWGEYEYGREVKGGKDKVGLTPRLDMVSCIIYRLDGGRDTHSDEGQEVVERWQKVCEDLGRGNSKTTRKTVGDSMVQTFTWEKGKEQVQLIVSTKKSLKTNTIEYVRLVLRPDMKRTELRDRRLARDKTKKDSEEVNWKQKIAGALERRKLHNGDKTAEDDKDKPSYGLPEVMGFISTLVEKEFVDMHAVELAVRGDGKRVYVKGWNDMCQDLQLVCTSCENKQEQTTSGLMLGDVKLGLLPQRLSKYNGRCDVKSYVEIYNKSRNEYIRWNKISAKSRPPKLSRDYDSKDVDSKVLAHIAKERTDREYRSDSYVYSQITQGGVTLRCYRNGEPMLGDYFKKYLEREVIILFVTRGLDAGELRSDVLLVLDCDVKGKITCGKFVKGKLVEETMSEKEAYYMTWH